MKKTDLPAGHLPLTISNTHHEYNLFAWYNTRVTKKKISLYDYFQPARYSLSLRESSCQLIIEGKKLPPQSKRIILHQKGLKITAAKIIRNDRRGPTEHDVVRINHLPTFEQVRLHTADMLYPGVYVIELNYQLNPDKLQQLKKLGEKKPSRDLLPSIDEPEASGSASFEIK